MESATIWFTASSALWFVYSLGTSIAFFVIAFTVRRTRPDAFGFFLGASLVDLGNLVVGHIARAILPLMMRSSGGMDSYAVASFIESAFSAAVGSVGVVLLLMGIVKLARPQGYDPAAQAFAEGRYS